MTPITSAANAHYKAWLRLAGSPRETRLRKRALAEGLHLAQAAVDASIPVEAVLLRQGAGGEDVDRLAAAAVASGAESYELAPGLYDRISPAEHGAGLMLVVEVPAHRLPARIGLDVIYLDGVQDPGNVGTLLRTAAAAGVRDVLAGPSTAAVWSPRTLRAGQGAQFRLRLHELVTAEALARLSGCRWVGADSRGGESLWQAPLPSGPIGWIFGAEGAGLSAASRTLCERLVWIPVDSAVESLNVAAAAAVCLFERRRRLAAPQ